MFSRLSSTHVRLYGRVCNSDSESDDDENKKESKCLSLLRRRREGFRCFEVEANAPYPNHSNSHESPLAQILTFELDYDNNVATAGAGAGASCSSDGDHIKEDGLCCSGKRHKKPLKRKSGMQRLKTAKRNIFFPKEDYGGLVGGGMVSEDRKPRDMLLETWEGSSDSSSDLTAEEVCMYGVVCTQFWSQVLYR